MPVFEQGYRRYDGSVSPRSPILAMAWQNIRPRLRWWVWILLALLIFYPYVVWGVMVFLVTVGSGVFGGSPPAASGVSAAQGWIAYSLRAEPDPGRIFAAINGDTLWLFWRVIEATTLANIVIPAVACAGVLASDRATGATQIYFARPVTRLEYLLSKALTVAFFSSLTTLLPSLLLWAECIAFSANTSFIVHTWWAPLSILGASAIYALWSGSIVLALSATIRRPVLVAVCAIFLYVLATSVSLITYEATQVKAWRLLSPGYALPGIVAPLYGGALPEWLESPWLPFGTILVPLMLLAFVWWRVRAVEVVT